MASSMPHRAFLLGLVGLVLLWSGLSPRDRFTWFMEVFPVLIAVPVLLATGRRFPFTNLAYGLMALHAIILMVGGKYTYAEMPFFNWIRDEFGLARNYYDRLGHLAQGFVPAVVAREILVRQSPLKKGAWLFVTVTSLCLSASALYELLEWQTAVWTGEAAEAFLGTQGDIWDTQWDMFLALAGALTSQILLGPFHDSQMADVRIPPKNL